MWLQIFQFLIVSCIASHGEGRDVNGRSKYHSFIHQSHLRKEGPPSSERLHRYIVKDEAMSRIRSNPDITRVLKINPQLNEKHGKKSTQDIRFTGMRGYFGAGRNKLIERKVDNSEKKYAQVSWNQFIYKMNVNYPVKMQERLREFCKILQFTQNITHESRDNVVIQNNLYFGKCNPFYIPNQRDQLSSRCRPFKFTLNFLKLFESVQFNVIQIIMKVGD